MKRPVITLLTDFGSSDHYVGAMKGVMLGVCPDCQFVDISHDISPYAVAEGAYTLAQAWRWFPKDTVHLVVVDPGVGSSRRPVIVKAGGHFLVAPDNGVLTMVLNEAPDWRMREITSTRYFSQKLSRTFHGRDLFSPVAAHLAAGVPFSRFGRRIEDPVRLEFAEPIEVGPGLWRGTIFKVDRFGNLITSFRSQTWRHLAEKGFQLRVEKQSISKIISRYSDAAAGELFVIEGSSGYLEISVRQDSAHHKTGGGSGTPVDLTLLS